MNRNRRQINLDSQAFSLVRLLMRQLVCGLAVGRSFMALALSGGSKLVAVLVSTEGGLWPGFVHQALPDRRFSANARNPATRAWHRTVQSPTFSMRSFLSPLRLAMHASLHNTNKMNSIINISLK